jgi:hypothetical protein
MSITGHIRASAGYIVRVRLRRKLNAFLELTKDCQQTQAKVLSSLIQLNRDSRFGRDHGLHKIASPKDLVERIPVNNYEFYRSYIDDMKTGDHQALLGPENRLMMFSLSSGTTADSKFIPITDRFFSDYHRGWQLWGISAFDAHVPLKRMNIVQLSSDFERYRTDGDTPCGNISGLAAVMQRPSVKFMYTLPVVLSKIDTPEAKYYTALRIALADDNVGMITTANPSTLVHMSQLCDRFKEDLIRDIYDGRLNPRYKLSPYVQGQLARKLGKRSRGRAQQLEKIVNSTGTLYPKEFWPNLQVVAVWTGGSCAAYLPTLREYFGDTAVRDHGLSASEGRMTIPLEDESPDGVLDIESHYFEFIPEDEYGNDDPTVLGAHELRSDCNYFILLSTPSGFLRYDICDVVRCVGFAGTTPRLRFLHKGAHIASVTGEKLSESQVVEAVKSTLEEFQHRVSYFTLAPTWGQPPRYELMLESSELPGRDAKNKFEARVDARLCELNCEYQEKRGTGRLDPVRIATLKNGSWTQFAAQRQSSLGGSIEQYKHPCLLPNLEHAATMKKQFELV